MARKIIFGQFLWRKPTWALCYGWAINKNAMIECLLDLQCVFLSRDGEIFPSGFMVIDAVERSLVVRSTSFFSPQFNMKYDAIEGQPVEYLPPTREYMWDINNYQAFPSLGSVWVTSMVGIGVRCQGMTEMSIP